MEIFTELSTYVPMNQTRKLRLNNVSVDFLQGDKNPTTYFRIFNKDLEQNTLDINYQSAKEGSIFLHITYHPENPRSVTIQQIWKTLVDQPSYQLRLGAIGNQDWKKNNISRMIIAYNRMKT